MKRKPIIVTLDNIEAVKGMVDKYFNNKKGNTFKEWHNFDIGFKKRFKPYVIKSSTSSTSVAVCCNKYFKPENIEIRRYSEDYPYNNIAIEFSKSIVHLISVGDKIMFMGNKFVHASKWYDKHHNYVYTIYQMTRFSNKENEDVKRRYDYENMIKES